MSWLVAAMVSDMQQGDGNQKVWHGNNTLYESNNIFLGVFFIFCASGEIFSKQVHLASYYHIPDPCLFPEIIRNLRICLQFFLTLQSYPADKRYLTHSISCFNSDKTIKSGRALGHLIIIICTDPRSQIGSNLIVKDTDAVPRVKRAL